MKLSPKQRRAFKNKVAGSVYGFVIGDMLGSRVQASAESGDHASKRCVTFKTKAMIVVMRALEETLQCKDSDYIAHIDEDTRDRFKKICAGELSLLKQDANVVDAELLRALPCALCGVPELNQAQVSITCNDDEVTRIAMSYAELILAVVSCDDDKSIGQLLKAAPASPGASKQGQRACSAFRCAVYWASSLSNDFDTCMRGALDGSDATSIVALTGAIAGARFGMSKIPVRRLAMIDKELFPEMGAFINFVVDHSSFIFETMGE